MVFPAALFPIDSKRILLLGNKLHVHSRDLIG